LKPLTYFGSGDLVNFIGDGSGEDLSALLRDKTWDVHVVRQGYAVGYGDLVTVMTWE